MSLSHLVELQAGLGLGLVSDQKPNVSVSRSRLSLVSQGLVYIAAYGYPCQKQPQLNSMIFKGRRC